MLRYPEHGNATSNVLAWSSHSANVESVADDEAAADADEPPDSHTMASNYQASPQFRRASVTKAKENHASLLTQALQSASEGESPDNTPVPASRRRRSITSQISLASTADLTSDTGLSTPARTNTPSPRLPAIGFAPLPLDKHHGASGLQIIGSLPRRPTPMNLAHDPAAKPAETRKDPAVEAIAKKRCISFACAKPKDDAPKPKAPVPAPAATLAPAAAAQPAQPRKTCIKFACTARPSTQQTPPQKPRLETPKVEESGSVSTVGNKSPTAARKARSPVAARSRPSPRRSAQSPVASRKKRFITANSKDLQGEICHFHEFASDHPTEEDWIRQEKCIAKARLTMDDLLKKENDIRRLGKEAEEEAEQEEEDEDNEGALEDDDDEENADDDDDELVEEEDMEEDDKSGYGSDDDFSDGYNTDEEYGFAESDDEENDGLHLWTFGVQQSSQARGSEATPVFRPWSLGDHHSDSSTGTGKHVRGRHSQSRLTGRPVTPELPDSTDFVCGTMDEDRPLEEAYLTRLAARKQEKLRVIPQDIDPSFPTSEPEEDDDDDVKPSHGSGDHLWLHGEIEELEEERGDRRHRRGENGSPKRLRSPPPKRFRSPPPKVRGRSPRRLFDRASPKRIKSPAPQHATRSPRATPTHAENVLAFKTLASRPGLTHTKSLPRGAYFPAHVKSGKRTRANTASRDSAHHVRGAIDIVKGLEHKRQRRKEKFYQKYCNRARKGQIPEKKAQPGEGAERMRELGLILAGKMGQGNYVISI